MGERQTLDATHTGNRRPSQAPSCSPHNAQSRLARARALGLVAGFQAQTPCTCSQWVLGHCRTPQGRAVGRGRAPNPRPPECSHEAPPPGALVPPPQRAGPARKSAHCGVGDGSPSPHPPHPQTVGSGPRPHAPRTGGRAWESTQPRTPHTQARGALLRALSCRPHGAQSELARPRAVGLVTGPRARIPPATIASS